MSANPPEPNPDERAENRADRTVTVAPHSSSSGAPAGAITGDGSVPLRTGNETGTFSSPNPNASSRGSETTLPPAPPGYELLGEVGRGGMGVVYQARQKGLNRIVALKVVLAGGHASATQRVRFLQEAEAVAALNHPGIVGVYEFGTWDGQPYVALEYCPRGTLGEKLAGTPLPAREAAALVERLTQAVALAHEKGIVHRDIKPANVLIGGDGTPKVSDFGIAKLTETGEGLTATGAIMGTPSYMAPEQARGDTKKVGPQADVYALGAVLYECLTGRPPFKGASSADTILQTLNQEPVGVRALNPLVPPDLETVCLKCLEKDPARRYLSAQTFAEDLRRFLDGRPVVARPVGWVGHARRWVRRNQVVTGLLATIVLAVATGTLATYVKYRDEAKQRTIAEHEAEGKEKALRELRVTLSALELLTEEQKQTLARLTEEKTTSEDAHLRGLLRPLREQQIGQLTFEEARVFFEFAALPEERLRIRFVTRALASPDGPPKLAAWPDEVVGGVAGLDRDAAIRLRRVLSETLKAEATTPAVRVACGFLAGVLPGDDPEFNRLGARALVDQMLAEKEPLTVNLLGNGLTPLVKRLDPPDAAALTAILVTRMVVEKDSVLLMHLGNGVTTLSVRFEATDARTLARMLTERVKAETNAAALLSLTTTLSALASRLPENEATAAIGVGARALVERLLVETEPVALGSLSSGLTGLVEHLSPTDAATFAEILMRRVLVEKEANALNQIQVALLTLSGRLRPEDAKTLTIALIERIIATKDSTSLSCLTYPVPQLIGRINPTEVDTVISPLARALATRLTTEKDVTAVSAISIALSSVAGKLNEADVLRCARTIVDRMVAEKDVNLMPYFNQGLTGLANVLAPTDATNLARTLAARMVVEKDPAMLNYLAMGVAELLPRLPEAESLAIASPLVQTLTVRVTSETDSASLNHLIPAVTTLANRLKSPEVVAVAKALVGRMVSEKDLLALYPLGNSLGVLSGSIPAADAASLASALVGRIALEKDYSALSTLSAALSGLAPRLRPEDVTPLAQKVLTRLATEKDSNVTTYLCSALGGLAAPLSEADAGGVARTLAARIATEKDYVILSSFSNALVALAPRLGPTDSAQVARAMTLRLNVEKDQNAANALGNAITALAGRLSSVNAAPIARTLTERLVTEKDVSIAIYLNVAISALMLKLGDADLLALLKPNVVFPPIRTSALAEFGRRSNHTHVSAAFAVAGVGVVTGTSSPPFPDVWEFVEWAAKNRPELDLHSPRPPEPR